MSEPRSLADDLAEKVWRGMSGNGSLKIDIDTDVQCYGPWAPDFKTIEEPGYAQSWVLHLVRSTLRHLAAHPDAGYWTRVDEAAEQAWYDEMDQA